MDKYRAAWLTTACIVLIVGCVCADLLLPAAALIWTALLSAVLLPGVAAVIYTAYAPERARTLLSKPVLAEAGAVAALIMIALLGFIDILGSAALQILVLFVFTSPAAVARLTGRPARSRVNPAAGRDNEPVPPGAIPAPHPRSISLPAPDSYAAVSDAELCWQWRASFTALQRADTASELTRLSQTRCQLLDELARRDPEGFDRWLNSGARAASSPARYLNNP